MFTILLELLAVSFSDIRDVVMPCWMVVSKHLEKVLLGNLEEEDHHWKPELCHPPWNNHDPHCHFSSDL